MPSNTSDIKEKELTSISDCELGVEQNNGRLMRYTLHFTTERVIAIHTHTRTPTMHLIERLLLSGVKKHGTPENLSLDELIKYKQSQDGDYSFITPNDEVLKITLNDQGIFIEKEFRKLPFYVYIKQKDTLIIALKQIFKNRFTVIEKK
ncbi:MAG: hypothetical protein FWD52_04000 [Candidatus Bathyarchaeota archaeon]|nr:hypothetical protein [Candidatus Termiticorpusculum sp.]